MAAPFNNSRVSRFYFPCCFPGRPTNYLGTLPTDFWARISNGRPAGHAGRGPAARHAGMRYRSPRRQRGQAGHGLVAVSWVVVPPTPSLHMKQAARTSNKSNGSPNPFPEKEEHREGRRKPVAAVAVPLCTWSSFGGGQKPPPTPQAPSLGVGIAPPPALPHRCLAC